MDALCLGLSAPCKGCKERKVGCHDDCPLYQAYRKDNEARKELQKKQMQKTDWGYREAFRSRNKRY